MTRHDKRKDKNRNIYECLTVNQYYVIKHRKAQKIEDTYRREGTLKLIDIKVGDVEEKVTSSMSLEVDGGFAQEEDGDCNGTKVLGDYLELEENFLNYYRSATWWK